MIKLLGAGIIGLIAFIGGLAVHPQPQEDPTVGVALPSGVAVFETSLQNRITSTDTSMTLVSTSTRGGGTLSGYQCFTIDEGRSDAEYVCGTIGAGRTVSGLERGIDPHTGTTTNDTLKFAHRVGANVKITDFPLIQRLRHQANGQDTFPNILRYASNPTFSSTTDIVTKKYVDDTAFSGAGVIDATSAARGVVELATQTETASSTSSGSSGPLAIPASNATSTCNGSTSALRVLVSDNSGYLDDDCLPATVAKSQTVTASTTHTATTSFTGTVTGTNGNKNYLNLNPTVAVSSTTVFSQPISANTLSTGNYYKTSVYIDYARLNNPGECNGTIDISYGNSSTTLVFPNAAPGRVGSGILEILLAANGATNSQKLAASLMLAATSTTASYATSTAAYASTATAIDSTTAQNLTMIVTACNFDPDIVTSELYTN